MSRLNGRALPIRNSIGPNGLRFAPINLTSAIAAQIRPIDLSNRIRIRPLPPGSGNPPGGGNNGDNDNNRPRNDSGGRFSNGLRDLFFLKEAMGTALSVSRSIGETVLTVTDKADKQVKDMYKLSMLTPNPKGMQEQLYQSALRSRSNLSDVNDSAIQMAMSAPNAFRTKGSNLVNVQQAMRVSETFTKMAKISGTSAEQAKDALLQFRQALGSGVLQGDELRSIKEAMPMISNYIADYMTKMGKFGKVTVGNLKDLGAKGKITSDIMVGAMEAAKEKIDKQFAGMPVSFSEAMTQISTQFQHAMIPISGMFGKMFNGNFFQPFFKAFNEASVILAEKMKTLMGLFQNVNGGDFMASLSNGIKALASGFGNLMIMGGKAARWIIQNWSGIRPIFSALTSGIRVATSAFIAIIGPVMNFISQLLRNKAVVDALCVVAKVLGILIGVRLVASIGAAIASVGGFVGSLTGLANVFGIVSSAGGGVVSIIGSIASSCANALGSVSALAGGLMRLVAMAGVAGAAVGAVAGSVALVTNKIATNKAAKMNEAQAGRALGRDIKKTSYKSAFSTGNAKSNYAVANSFVNNQGVSKIHDMKKSRGFLSELKQKYINNGNRKVINYSQAELKRARANYAAGYTNQRYMQVMAAAGMNKHYHTKVLAQEAARNKALKQQMNSMKNVQIFNDGGKGAAMPAIGGGGGSGGGGGRGHKGGGKGHKGHSTGTKNNPTHVKVVNPITLDDKYRDIMYGTAKMKWVNQYATAQSAPITVNINGDQYHSGDSDHEKLANNIGEAIRKQQQSRIIGAF